ncbi:hypothetical protein [Phytohabitans rumicis]|uniref:Uncharacterized protein n=1 Tax=Phytohabitans rumicis TaxID=1076125 RepID=A0A6V8LA11_9ACTN|nr:hypothetical protein [Phytohabitans rumicis]GFJ94043.1 hypothetical protein Prum_076850 [Phytohabitans rumicis]
MTKSYDNRNFIQLVAESAPDPIPAMGSVHKAVLDNHTGCDLFDATFSFALTPPGDQILAFGQAGCSTWSHRGGRVAARCGVPASVGVVLVNPPPSPVVADLDTTVTWTLSASQPLSGHPAKVYSRHCVPTLTAS